MGYLDDFGLIAIRSLVEDAPLACTEVSNISVFAPKLSKSEWGQLLEFMGLTAQLSLFLAGPRSLRPLIAKG